MNKFAVFSCGVDNSFMHWFVTCWLLVVLLKVVDEMFYVSSLFIILPAAYVFVETL